MSKLDWNRHNKKNKEWPDINGFDWSGKSTVPADTPPYPLFKIALAGLSPVFAGAAILLTLSYTDPETAQGIRDGIPLGGPFIKDRPPQTPPPKRGLNEYYPG